MVPHADMIYTINTLDYPQRLRHAANQRLAATAQVDTHPPVIMPASVHRVATTLFGGLLTRWVSAHRIRLARPLKIGATRATQSVR